MGKREKTILSKDDLNLFIKNTFKYECMVMCMYVCVCVCVCVCMYVCVCVYIYIYIDLYIDIYYVYVIKSSVH